MYRGPAPVVTSATTFGQWWVDGTWTGGTHSVGILEMNAIGGGQYQFSSQVNSVTGGFFPLDPAAHGFPLYTHGAGGPGHAAADGRDGADALQSVALLAQHRPRSARATAAAATSTCSRPA